MILKTSMQATENTEDTEMLRVTHIFHVHPMDKISISDNPSFLSVDSVFSVAIFFS